ncbi:kelch-like protein 10 [Quercus lobata]|uniref:kelch-like protein 10 n=1 Tax=Quercus lobata TaxID=97700 RepID=UPI00124637E3|nr:kelch-like protein 10 [Quercus lobata]
MAIDWSRLDQRGSIPTLSPLSDNRTWSQPVIRGRRPSPRAFHSCTTVRDELFVFGGIDANNHFNDMRIFNTSSHRWRSPRVVGNIPERRKWHSATLYRKSLYIFGGSGRSRDNNDETYYRNVYMFHTARFVWKRIDTFGSLPSPRNSHICSYQLNRMIVVGGKDGHDSFCSDVYVMQGLTWRERRTSGRLLPPRAGHAAVNFGAKGTKLYIFGGYTNQFLYNDVYVLDIVTGVWTKVITTGGRPSHRAFMTGDSLDLQRFVFYGGFNGRSEVCDDMYYLHTAYVERFRIRDLYISPEDWQNGHEWFEGELSHCDILNFGFMGELWKEEKTFKETRNRVKAAIDRVKDSISRMKLLRLSRNQFVFQKIYSSIIKNLQKRQNRLALEKSLLSSALWEVRYEVGVVLEKLKPSEKSVLFINSRSSYEAAIRLRNKYECEAIFHFCCKEGEAKMMGKLAESAHQYGYPYTVSGDMGVMSNIKFSAAYPWGCKLRADERKMERIFEERAKDERPNRNANEGSGRNKNVKEEEERKEGPSSSHYSYNNH